jgi:hypothetical protein
MLPAQQRLPADDAAVGQRHQRMLVQLQQDLLELLPQLGGDILLAEPGRPFAASFLAHWDVETVADRVYRLRLP